MLLLRSDSSAGVWMTFSKADHPKSRTCQRYGMAPLAQGLDHSAEVQIRVLLGEVGVDLRGVAAQGS